jgi:hypothetical protein
MGAWAAATIGAMIGSAASQVYAINVGLQDKFDWGAVAIAGVTAGATRGILGKAGTGYVAVDAVVRSVVGQGVNMLAGRQEEFSWSSLAVSAIAAPIASSISGALNLPTAPAMGASWEGFASEFARGLISGAVTQGVGILVNKGGRIDWANIAASALGNALGSTIAGQIRGEYWADREFGKNDAFEKQDGPFRTDWNGNVIPVPAAEAYFMGTEPATAYPLAGNQPSAGTALSSIHNGPLHDGGSDPINSNGDYSIRFSGNARVVSSDDNTRRQDEAYLGAYLDNINGRPYPQDLSTHGLSSFPTGFDPFSSEVSRLQYLACNDSPYILYPKAFGEALPYSRTDQLDYFVNKNRFDITLDGSQVGDVLFFGKHEATVNDVIEQDKITWVLPAGPRNEDNPAGVMTDRAGNPAYIRLTAEDGNVYVRGGSLIDGMISPWPNSDIRGFEKWVGRGMRPN